MRAGDGSSAPGNHATVLRWVYAYRAGRVQCELSLGMDDLLYEFRTSRSAPSSVSVERFGNVAEAFQRQCEFEAALLDDGWCLDSYEKVHAPPS